MAKTTRHTLGNFLELEVPETWQRRAADGNHPSTIFVTPGGIVVSVLCFPVGPAAPAPLTAKTFVELQYPGQVNKFKTFDAYPGFSLLEAVFPRLNDGVSRGFLFAWSGETGAAIFFHGPDADVALMARDVDPILRSLRFLGGRVALEGARWRLAPVSETRQRVEMSVGERVELRLQVPSRWTEVKREHRIDGQIIVGGDGFTQRVETIYATFRDTAQPLKDLVPATPAAGDSSKLEDFQHQRGYAGHRLHAIVGKTAIEAVAVDGGQFVLLLSLVGPDPQEAAALFDGILASLELPEYKLVTIARRELGARHPGLWFIPRGDRLFYTQPSFPDVEGEVFLGNLERAAAFTPHALSNMSRYFDGVTVCIPEPRSGWKATRERIFPFACAGSALPKGPGLDPFVAFPFERDLLTVFVADDDGRVCILTESRLEGIVSSVQDLFNLVWNNLATRLLTKQRVGKSPDGALRFMGWHEHRYSGALLTLGGLEVRGLHGLFGSVFGDRFFVAAPSSHDIVAIAADKDGNVPEDMRELVNHFYEISPHPFSRTIYEVTPNGQSPEKDQARRRNKKKQKKRRRR